jgi:hypothetical protein
MSLTVKVENKAFPDDHEFSINNLGLFQNGKAKEITKEEEQAFVDAVGMPLKDALAGEEFEVTGTATAKVPKVEEAAAEEATAEEEGGES